MVSLYFIAQNILICLFVALIFTALRQQMPELLLSYINGDEDSYREPAALALGAWAKWASPAELSPAMTSLTSHPPETKVRQVINNTIHTNNVCIHM